MNLRAELLTGMLFCGFGLAAAVTASQYDLGSLRSIGPGAFPFGVSCVLIAIGAVTTLNALWRDAGETVAIALVPLLAIALAVGFFGIAINDLGLVPALIGLVVIGRLAGGRISWPQLGGMILVYLALGYLIFGLGLGINFKLV